MSQANSYGEKNNMAKREVERVSHPLSQAITVGSQQDPERVQDCKEKQE